MWKCLLIFFLFPAWPVFQVSDGSETVPKDGYYKLPYVMESYDSVVSLPYELVEISGLGYDLKRSLLVAVNDERGYLYYLDPGNGEVIEKIDFGTSGDYEGIEWINGQIFVVKSNGDLFLYDASATPATRRIKTSLKAGNDIEGLAFAPSYNSLLLACKGRAQIDKEDKIKGMKAIYRYDLGLDSLYPEPVFIIDDLSLQLCMQDRPGFKDLSVKRQQKLLKRAKNFSPSGIARHPVSGDFYILSSAGKLLVVLDDRGELIWIEPLDDDFHRQPEGICFDAAANLYISNEGKGLVAKLYLYKYKGQ